MSASLFHPHPPMQTLRRGQWKSKSRVVLQIMSQTLPATLNIPTFPGKRRTLMKMMKLPRPKPRVPLLKKTPKKERSNTNRIFGLSKSVPKTPWGEGGGTGATTSEERGLFIIYFILFYSYRYFVKYAHVLSPCCICNNFFFRMVF
jgi:hypothetical protein